MQNVTVIYPTWASQIAEAKRQLQALQANYSPDLPAERRQHLADDMQGIADYLDGLHDEAEALGLLDKEMFKSREGMDMESNHHESDYQVAYVIECGRIQEKNVPVSSIPLFSGWFISREAAETVLANMRTIVDLLLTQDAQSLLLSSWHLAQFVEATSSLAWRFECPVSEDDGFLTLHQETFRVFKYLCLSEHEHEPREALYRHLDRVLSRVLGQEVQRPPNAAEPDFVVSQQNYRRALERAMPRTWWGTDEDA